jgi:hypothetical protein
MIVWNVGFKMMEMMDCKNLMDMMEMMDMTKDQSLEFKSGMSKLWWEYWS